MTVRLALAVAIAITARNWEGTAAARRAQQTEIHREDLVGVWLADLEHAGERSTVAFRIEKTGNGELRALWSTPSIHVWDVPVGAVTVDGSSVHVGPFTLERDAAAGTLSGVLPPALVPVYSVRAVFRKTNAIEKTPRAKPARVATPRWTFEAAAPLWADLTFYDGLVIAGDDAGRVQAIDATTGKRVWTFTAGGAVRARTVCSGADAFVQSDDGVLHKLDAKTGVERWHAAVSAAAHRLSIGDPKSRYDYRGSAVAVDDTRAYVGTHDGKVLALDRATGARQWEFAAADTISSSVVVDRGRVYFGSFDGNVYAVDARSGTSLWRHDTGAAVTSTPAIFGNVAIVGSRSYDLTAFDARDGKRMWTNYFWFSWVESSPTLFDGTIYIGSSDAAIAAAIDPGTRRRTWTSDVDGSAWGAPAVTNARVFVSAAGMQNYLVPHRGAAIALDRATGSRVWQFSAVPPVSSSNETVPYGFAGGPALGPRFVYFPSLDGRVYAFDQ